MPSYYNRSGQQVSADEALINGRVIRDGYRQQLAPGDYVNFDLSMFDGASRGGSVYITDNPADPHAWARNLRDFVRDNQAFIPQRACFDPDRHTGLQDAPATGGDTNRMVRDLARASQYSQS